MPRIRVFDRKGLLGAVAASALLSAAGQGHALTITPTFDTSITSDPNASQIEATVDHAVQFYSLFSDPVNVKIIYALAPVGLGANEATLYGGAQPSGGIAYSDYVAGLQADAASHPGNLVLQTALANLGSGNQLDILASSANLRALGLDTPGAFGTDLNFGTGDFDAVVFLDPSAGLNFSGNPVPGLFETTQVIQHETDEVLGVGGSGTLLGSGLESELMGIEDIYRYSGFHTPSYTDDTTASAYFSIDGGATDIMDFNQNGQGDYADWAKQTCEGAGDHVQDWAGCPFPLDAPVSLNLKSPEVIALQALGYNLGVPEPSAWVLMLAGFGLAGAALRRRRPALA
jgi:hypothetical protein